MPDGNPPDRKSLTKLQTLALASFIGWAAYISVEVTETQITSAGMYQMLKDNIDRDKSEHRMIEADVKDLEIRFDGLRETVNKYFIEGHYHAKQ